MKLPSVGFCFAPLMSALLVTVAQAAPVYMSFDLRSGSPASLPPGFISYSSGMADSNGDGWYETVLKINLSVYQFAQFRVSYDAAPTGLSVNIGDSVSNNGGGGDSGNQSNDAELQVGSLIGDNANYGRLLAIGNDANPAVLANVSGLATLADDLFLTVGNEYAAWGGGSGQVGSVTSPNLFALNGQPDSEGPVNYDIYAAFNRSIGSVGRIGAGVGQVTVCLSNDQSCFAAIPTPATLLLVLLALGLIPAVGSLQPKQRQ